MDGSEQSQAIETEDVSYSQAPKATRYDAVVVGASLAGCATAILLARGGLRVALVEKRPDPMAFKRICGHFIQPSAVPALQRLGLLDPIVDAGGLRSRLQIWTRWGVIDPAPPELVPPGVNIRRERLDPILREIASGQDGVDLLLGHTVTELIRDGETITGVQARTTSGHTLSLGAPLVVGADGRESGLAKLAKVPVKVRPHGRFSYAAYFEGPLPERYPDGTIWMLDPQVAAAFPTDCGLVMYAAMPTKDRLPEFRRDPEGALRSFIADLPDAPPILESHQVGPMTGKIEMPNLKRAVIAPGLALVGDAALAIDPLFGVGCGWAFQSAEWLADSVAPALHGQEPLQAGLARYRRRHRRGLDGHAFLIQDYANGRRFSVVERVLFPAAVSDERVRESFCKFGTRSSGAISLAPTLVRAAGVMARQRGSSFWRGRESLPSTPEALA